MFLKSKKKITVIMSKIRVLGQIKFERAIGFLRMKSIFQSCALSV